MKLPTIGIVTPSLNQGRFIRSAITSVLDQDYKPLEYLVMDGGSQDESCAIVRDFAPRVTLVSEKDEGQTDAINKGFARLSSEIIGWLNADDCYAPGALKKVAAAFAEHPDLSLVYGGAEWMDESGNRLGATRQLGPFSLEELLQIGNFIVQPAAFFRREAFVSVGGLRNDLHWSMDYDLWIRLGKFGKARYLPETLALVRYYPETKTASGGQQRIAEFESVARRYGAPGLPGWFVLEAVRLDAREALGFARERCFRKALASMVAALKRMVASQHMVSALASWRTWRVILTAVRRDHSIAAARKGRP